MFYAVDVQMALMVG